MAKHLSFGPRKALSGRLLAALHLEGASYGGTADLKKTKAAILEQIVRTADRLEEHDEPLDESLHRLAEAMPGLHQRWHSSTLAQAHGMLARELNDISCDRCAGARACRGDDDDDIVVTEHGECIAPILSLVRHLHQRCAALHKGLIQTVPEVELSTDRQPEHYDADLLGMFGVSGWHRVTRRSPLASVVGLTIRDEHFDLRSAFSLYYIVLHELLCHAFQGAQSLDDREACHAYCPWSEGWMDRLAFELAREWLSSAVSGLPNWLIEHRAEVEDISGEIHIQRCRKSPNLPDLERERRVVAREAFGNLRTAWSRTGRLLENRITAFSVRLNIVNMPSEERRRIGHVITDLLFDDQTRRRRCGEGDAGMDSPRLMSERFRLSVGECGEFATGLMGWPAFRDRIDQLTEMSD